MKKWLTLTAVALLLSLCFSCMTMAAQAEWTEDSEGWRYRLEDETYIKNQWQQIDNRWYYFNKDGYMVTGHRKIDGTYYFFKDSGAMAVGWYLDEESDLWYYFDPDGTRHKGWLFYEGAWYWFSSKGTMIYGGYRSVDGYRYYFYENGEMAANQYVGTYYYDQDGKRNSRYDIVISGDRKPTTEEKDRITQALKDVPRKWIKQFVESGWKMMYYTEKPFFSAPDTEAGVYYLYHKVDTDYEKLKFTNPDSLTRAMGETIGHLAGCYEEGNTFQASFYMLLDTLPDQAALPGYFSEDIMAQFGVVFESFVREENTEEFSEYAPELYALMGDIIGYRPVKRALTLEEEIELYYPGPGYSGV